MKLSVVMPVYNEQATLQAVIDRVLAVPLDIELICVDDGSSDGSREILSGLHASYAHAQAQAWNRVVLAIEVQLDVHPHPLLLVRLAEAYARQSGREAARRLWTRLCWEHPQTAAEILSRAPGDEGIARRWREFTSADAELPPEDFPAWLLIADLAQRSHVPRTLAPATPTGRVYAAVHELVSSNGAMSARAALHALRPELLRIYLDRRRAVYEK